MSVRILIRDAGGRNFVLGVDLLPAGYQAAGGRNRNHEPNDRRRNEDHRLRLLTRKKFKFSMTVVADCSSPRQERPGRKRRGDDGYGSSDISTTSAPRIVTGSAGTSCISMAGNSGFGAETVFTRRILSTVS